MEGITGKALWLSAIVFLTSRSGYSTVRRFDIQYTTSHLQTGEGSLVPMQKRFVAGILTTDPNDALSGSFVLPSMEQIPFIVDKLSPGLFAYSAPFETESDLTSSFPAGGPYKFCINSGNLTGQEGSLVVPAIDFPQESPLLTSGSYSSLQNCAPDYDLHIHWNRIISGGFMQENRTGVHLYDRSTTGWNSAPWGINVPNTAPTFATIPGALIKGGHRYDMLMQHWTATETSNAGFMGAPGVVGFYRYTWVSFRARAVSGTFAGQLQFQGALRQEGRNVLIQVLNDNLEVVEAKHATTGLDGLFATQLDSRGIRKIRIYCVGFLSHLYTSVNLDAGTSDTAAQLLNGDIDHDNTITTNDYLILSKYFNFERTDFRWNLPDDEGWRPSDADLDGDGTVGTNDYLLISTNFDLTGQ